jgi:hypothetical protein
MLEHGCCAFGVFERVAGRTRADDLRNVELAKREGYIYSLHTPEAFTKDVWMEAVEKVTSA